MDKTFIIHAKFVNRSIVKKIKAPSKDEALNIWQSKKDIQKRDPNHPVLKKFFPSTWEAIERYELVMRELDAKERKQHAKK